jgi:hypothetical protein
MEENERTERALRIPSIVKFQKYINRQKMAPGISNRSHFSSVFMPFWMVLECVARYGPAPYKMV